MSLIPVVGICPKCGAVRVRSTRPYAPNERLNPADFTPEDGQETPVDGQPVVCSFCTEPLVFRREPSPDTPARHTQTLPSVRDNGHGPTNLRTLFQAEPGEDIIATREPTPGVLIIQTSRRVVLLDLNAALITIQETP